MMSGRSSTGRSRSGIKLEKVKVELYATGRVGEDDVDHSQAIMSDHADRFTT